MPNAWFDVISARQKLAHFFEINRSQLRYFGNTVNQTFEAFVFASVVNWYKNKDWIVELVNPDPNSTFPKLKFSTRGRPNNYTYAVCTKDNMRIQVRHGLRVATKYYENDCLYRANIVLDVAVIFDTDLSYLNSNDHVDHRYLITFGEAKHMSAFAELVASFVGLVHEIMPDCLELHRIQGASSESREHPAPFLYVSGTLYPTAQGVEETIRRRGYDIDIYDNESGNIFGLTLSTRPRRLRLNKSSSEPIR